MTTTNYVPAVPHVLERLGGGVVLLDHQVGGRDRGATAVSHVAAENGDDDDFIDDSIVVVSMVMAIMNKLGNCDNNEKYCGYFSSRLRKYHQMKTRPQRMLRALSMKLAQSSKKSVMGAAGRSCR